MGVAPANEYDDLRERIYPGKLTHGIDLDESEVLRHRAHEFGLLILDTLSNSRERSLALTALEETLMWAQQALQRERGVR